MRRRSGRVVECTGLENRRTARYRGFESLLLRIDRKPVRHKNLTGFVILSGPMALIVAGTLTITAIFGKWVAAFITQIAFKFTKGQRRLIFGLSSSHAAATLAVVLVGYKAGILDDNILNATVVIILVTCIVASFVPENAAKSIVQDSNEDEHLHLSTKSDIENILISIANLEKIEKVIEFGVLIKEKKSKNPLTLLTVVPNTVEAEKSIVNAKKELSKLIKETTASDTHTSIVATIDHNTESGISRTAKEIIANIILIEWTQKTGFLDEILSNKVGSVLRRTGLFGRLISHKMESLLENTDKTLFLCDFEAPLVNHMGIFLIVPPHAELEEGFAVWFKKIVKLSLELSIPILLNCHDDTFEAIMKFTKIKKKVLKLSHVPFDDWDDFLILSRKIVDTDLIIFVSAREGLFHI